MSQNLSNTRFLRTGGREEEDMAVMDDGRIIAGKYRLERMLARGGMGEVWVGRHIHLDSPVAIKFLTSELGRSPDARMRFEREAKASAQLRHPHVVQVHDYGVEDDAPYLVMEFLEGEDLEARLQRERRLSPQATQRIVNALCKALRHAHQMGLVHRDLKPGNIFIARQADEELVKILDFGIAKTSSLFQVGPATKTGALLGSPFYMSPEQVRRSRDVDPRSDLWSLGVIVYRCLTGYLPFAGEELGEVLVAICTENVPLPSQKAPDIDGRCDAFLMRALMRDPAERFQSAQEFEAAFAAMMNDTGVFHESVATLPFPAKALVGTLAATESHIATPTSKRTRKIGIPLVLVATAMLVGFFLAARLLFVPAAPPAPTAPTTAAPAQSTPSASLTMSPEPPPVVELPSALPSALPDAMPSALPDATATLPVPKTSNSAPVTRRKPIKATSAPPTTTSQPLLNKTDDPLKQMR